MYLPMHRPNVQCLRILLCSPAQPLYTLTWKHQSSLRIRTGVLSSSLPSFLYFVFFSFARCRIPYFHFWMLLYSITMFLYVHGNPPVVIPVGTKSSWLVFELAIRASPTGFYYGERRADMYTLWLPAQCGTYFNRLSFLPRSKRPYINSMAPSEKYFKTTVFLGTKF
jgi:hypothetical protein